MKENRALIFWDLLVIPDALELEELLFIALSTFLWLIVHVGFQVVENIDVA